MPHSAPLAGELKAHGEALSPNPPQSVVENTVNSAGSLIERAGGVAARNKGKQVGISPNPATAADPGANRRVKKLSVKPSHRLAN
eukprot:7562849-Alexandrium_andersonii.AAC.1